VPKHYLFTGYNRHIWLSIHLVSSGTTNGWRARLVMLLVTPVFSVFPSHGKHDGLFTPIFWHSRPQYSKFPLIKGAGRNKSLTPITLLPSPLARTNLIGYELRNQIECKTLYSSYRICSKAVEISRSWKFMKGHIGPPHPE